MSAPTSALFALSLVLLACSPTPAPAPTPAASSTAPPASPVASTSAPAPQASASAAAPAAPPCPSLPPRRPLPQEKAPEAAARACERRAEASRGKVKAASAEAPAWLASHWPGVARCVGDGKGAWLLEVESFKKDADGLSGAFRMVRFSADGKATASGFTGPFGQLAEGARAGAAVVASVDVDGDGSFEVLVERSGYHGGGEDSWKDRKLMRLQGKELVEVPLPVDKKIARSIDEVTDVDGDGKIDLILESPFRIDVPCTLDGEAGGPRTLLHGSAKGFSVDDEVVHQFLRVECSTALVGPLALAPAEGEDPRIAVGRTALAIGCARLGGTPIEALKARLTREAPAADPGHNCAVPMPALEGAASVQPPLTVPNLLCRR